MRVVSATSVQSASPREVAPQRTRASAGEIRGALGRAYTRLHGKPPTTALLDVLTAQANLETGRGASMFNYNFGGIKGASPSGMTAHYGTREVIGGQSQHMVQGFRAYSSLEDGAVDYLTTLRGHFGAAYAKAEAGDVDGFVHGLKQSGYFTASESDYATLMRSLVKEQSGAVAAQAAPRSLAMAATSPIDVGSLPTADQVARVVDAVLASTARIAAPIEDA